MKFHLLLIVPWFFLQVKQELKLGQQRIEGLTEDIEAMHKENKLKDDHISRLNKIAHSQSTSSSSTSSHKLEDTIEQLREANQAHQAQNAFLASEVFFRKSKYWKLESIRP